MEYAIWGIIFFFVALILTVMAIKKQKDNFTTFCSQAVPMLLSASLILFSAGAIR